MPPAKPRPTPRIHVQRRLRQPDGFFLGWAIKREDKERATAVYYDQKDAMKKAKALAREERGILLVHDAEKDEKIVEELDFSAKAKAKPKKKTKKA
jgi:Uncharacterized protein conserved in bacteria (DUF2188)